MFLHFGKTSAIIAPTLAKEPTMKTAQKKLNRPMPTSSEKDMGKTMKKAAGGMVTGYKNGGCVMSGRGGKYKGMK